MDKYSTREVANYWNSKGLLPGMVMEEAAELIQAINKHERKGTEETRKAIIDEIGDLLIILDGYAQIHDITDQDIVDRMNYKLSLKKED